MRALNRFVWLTAVATLFLICSGGMVTSKGVGLAVPDWPTTFGYNMFAFPISQWVGGVFFEHTHRLIASTVGFLTIILAIWIWRKDSRRWMRVLGLVSLGAVVLQGVLGGLRVTMLKDEIGIFHACLAQAFLGLLVFMGVATSRRWDENKGAVRLTSSWLPIMTTVVIYAQLALGATMRHQHRDLAIVDFPRAYGQIMPDTSPASIGAINLQRDKLALSDVNAAQIWLQMAHRFLALFIFICVVATCFAQRTKLSVLWVLCVLCQVSLGAWVIWSNKAADIATAHVAVGATMLGLGVAICAWALRARSPNESKNFAAKPVEEAHAL